MAIGGQNTLHIHVMGITVKIRNHGPGFLRNEGTCGRIPGFQILFPEAVKTSSGKITKIKGGSTQPANSLGFMETAAGLLVTESIFSLIS